MGDERRERELRTKRAHEKKKAYTRARSQITRPSSLPCYLKLAFGDSERRSLEEIAESLRKQTAQNFQDETIRKALTNYSASARGPPYLAYDADSDTWRYSPPEQSDDPTFVFTDPAIVFLLSIPRAVALSFSALFSRFPGLCSMTLPPSLPAPILMTSRRSLTGCHSTRPNRHASLSP